MPRRTCHDDYPLLAQSGHPVYGGLPNKLADGGLERAKALLLEGQHCTVVAYELGYVNGCAFGWAFQAMTGERPGAFQKRHGVKRLSLRGGLHGVRPRTIKDRTKDTPLPRYKRDRPRSIGT